MEPVLDAFLTGVTAFAATNIDDIVVLMVFFSQVSDRFRPRHIVIGQYLGFLSLLLLCLPGFLGGLFLPKSWLGLLGILPIAIGLHQWLNGDDDDSTIQTVSEEVNHAIPKSKPVWHPLRPEVYQVAAVTIANGGDNVGVYVPLFARSDLFSLTIIVSVFLSLVGVWCVAAYYLASHPAIAPLLTRYANRIVPFLLIALGLYILIESESYRLIPFLASL